VFRRKLEEDEQEFPDEVEVPRDGVAYKRFWKYRPLASFRTSKWDEKLNCPFEYGYINRLEDFKNEKKFVSLSSLSEKTKQQFLSGNLG
jgi:pre-rRNA-processing protein TSR1